MKKYAIIVAGGNGSRMRSEVPKQFLLLAGKPILIQTIRCFRIFTDIEIVLVLPASQKKYWDELCTKYHFTSPVVIAGGDTRFQSVKNGLDYIQEDGLVSIHDGVRPFTTKSLIVNSFKFAEKYGSAITAVKLKDSIRQLIGANNYALEREDFRLIQTPQTFNVSLLKKAYNTKYSSKFTDDASVFEESGNKIHLIEGDYRNIKITTPEDLVVAEALFAQFKMES